MGEALEDYLEAILILSNQNKAVRSVDLAVYRGYSRVLVMQLKSLEIKII